MSYVPSPRKAKGVLYFNHYPKNFLRPYGRAEAFPQESVTLSRLKPEGCEWLRRPHVAVSELSSTLNDNIPLLLGDGEFLDSTKMQHFAHLLQPVATLLQSFHKDSDISPTDAQCRDLLSKLINPGSNLDKSLSAAVEVGAALFSIGVNYKVAKTLLSNPERFADLMTFAPAPDPTFKTTKNILDLVPLLQQPSTVPESSTANVQRLLNALRTPSNSYSPSHTQAHESTNSSSSDVPHDVLSIQSTMHQPESLPATRKRHKRRLIEDSDDNDTEIPYTETPDTEIPDAQPQHRTVIHKRKTRKKSKKAKGQKIKQC